MRAGVLWWLPRLLGMAPALLIAGVLLWRVGDIGVARPMACLLILEALALLGLLYSRTRLGAWLLDLRPLRDRVIPRRVVEALAIRSGQRDGLFTPRFELLLMALAWMILALMSGPSPGLPTAPSPAAVGTSTACCWPVPCCWPSTAGWRPIGTIRPPGATGSASGCCCCWPCCYPR